MQSRINTTRAIIYTNIANLEEAVELIDETITLLDKQHNPREYAHAMYALGAVYWRKGQHDQALEALEMGRISAEIINNAYLLYNILVISGNVLQSELRFDDALGVYFKALEISTRIDNPIGIGVSTINIAEVYRRQGKLDESLTLLTEVEQIFLKNNNLQNLAATYDLMGSIFESRGSLDEALELHKKSEKIRNSIDHQQDLSRSYRDTARVYWKKGILETASRYFLKSLKIEQITKNETDLSKTYFSLVILSSDMDQIADANRYLRSIEKLANESTNKLIDIQYQLAHAYLLKQKNQIELKAEAQQIFKRITESKNIEFSLLLFALTNLCELLIFELQVYGGTEVFEEVKELVGKIHALAKENKLSLLLAEAYAIEANIALFELHIDQAKEYLTKAFAIAEEHGFNRLKSKLIEQRENLDEEIKKWIDLINKNASFIERVEYSNILDYIKLLSNDLKFHDR
jgi:tetratricopeptide (TPR) repeat protein